jgi:Zn-dependent metalloprotease
MKRTALVTMLLIVAWAASAAVSPQALARQEAQEWLAARSLAPLHVVLDAEPGAAYVRGLLPVRATEPLAAALEVVRPAKGLWGLDDPERQLRVRDLLADEEGFTHLVLQQRVGDVPVRNAWLVVHRDPRGAVVAIHGRLAPGAPTVAASPRLSGDAATRVALAALPWVITPSRAPRGELVYVPWRGSAVLAWSFDLPTLHPRPARFQVTVDASTGEILELWDALATLEGTGAGSKGAMRTFAISQDATGYTMSDTTRGKGILTYSANGGYSRGQLVRSNSTVFDRPLHPAAVDGHFFAAYVYDFYKALGRDSIDDQGMKIISTVHYGNAWANAAWDGTQMVYGDGDPATSYPYSAGLDVVAHELTHGVDEYTINLEYRGQSGALNEAWSDIMGFFADPDDWLMGEDLFKDGSAIRSFENPALYGQPAHIDDYIYTRSDNLGVHYNSSIFNHALYHQVQTLGTSRLGDLARIYYRVMEARYMTPTATFWDAREAVEQAARDLFGEGSDILPAISASYDAVGVSGEPRALMTLFVPTAASNQGQAGSNWVTDLRMVNTGQDPLDVTVWYSVSGGDNYPANTPPKKKYTIAAGAVAAIDDVVAREFAKQGTKGGLEFRPSRNHILVASRTYNQTGNGTYGQYVGAVDAVDGPTTATPQHILMLSGGGRYRSNIGIIETRGLEAFVRFVLHDAAGTEIANKLIYVGPWQHRQEELFAWLETTPIDNCRLEIRATDDSPVAVHASVIDNVSNDAVYVPSFAPMASGGPALVPVVIRKAGLAGSLWRSDVYVANLRGESADVGFAYTPSGGGAPLTASRAVAAGETLQLQDVVATLFATDGTQGQLTLAAADGTANGLVVTSRTYTVATTASGEASFGQFVPAVPLSAAGRPGEVMVLPFLTGGDAFRTNLGVVETAGENADVAVDLVRTDGSVIATLTRTLKPRESYQFLRSLDGRDLGTSPAATAQVRITSTTGRVVAYASVIDNITNDPINVPMGFSQ